MKQFGMNGWQQPPSSNHDNGNADNRSLSSPTSQTSASNIQSQQQPQPMNLFESAYVLRSNNNNNHQQFFMNDNGNDNDTDWRDDGDGGEEDDVNLVSSIAPVGNANQMDQNTFANNSQHPMNLNPLTSSTSMGNSSEDELARYHHQQQPPANNMSIDNHPQGHLAETELIRFFDQMQTMIESFGKTIITDNTKNQQNNNQMDMNAPSTSAGVGSSKKFSTNNTSSRFNQPKHSNFQPIRPNSTSTNGHTFSTSTAGPAHVFSASTSTSSLASSLPSTRATHGNPLHLHLNNIDPSHEQQSGASPYIPNIIGENSNVEEPSTPGRSTSMVRNYVTDLRNRAMLPSSWPSTGQPPEMSQHQQQQQQLNNQMFRLLMSQNNHIQQQHQLIRHWFDCTHKSLNRAAGSSSNNNNVLGAQQDVEMDNNTRRALSHNMMPTTPPAMFDMGDANIRRNVDNNNPTLMNNQTAPRSRENNFWDNFKSQAHQNQLRGESAPVRQQQQQQAPQPSLIAGTEHRTSKKNNQSQQQLMSSSNRNATAQPTSSTSNVNVDGNSGGHKNINADRNRNIFHLSRQVLSMVEKLVETDNTQPSTSSAHDFGPTSPRVHSNVNLKRKKMSNLEQQSLPESTSKDVGRQFGGRQAEDDSDEDSVESDAVPTSKGETINKFNYSNPFSFSSSSSSPFSGPSSSSSLGGDHRKQASSIITDRDKIKTTAATDNQKLSMQHQHHWPDESTEPLRVRHNPATITNKRSEIIRPLMLAEGRSSENTLPSSSINQQQQQQPSTSSSTNTKSAMYPGKRHITSSRYSYFSGPYKFTGPSSIMSAARSSEEDRQSGQQQQQQQQQKKDKKVRDEVVRIDEEEEVAEINSTIDPNAFNNLDHTVGGSDIKISKSGGNSFVSSSTVSSSFSNISRIVNSSSISSTSAQLNGTAINVELNDINENVLVGGISSSGNEQNVVGNDNKVVSANDAGGGGHHVNNNIEDGAANHGRLHNGHAAAAVVIPAVNNAEAEFMERRGQAVDEDDEDEDPDADLRLRALAGNAVVRLSGDGEQGL